jgi:hypothetical protein
VRRRRHYAQGVADASDQIYTGDVDRGAGAVDSQQVLGNGNYFGGQAAQLQTLQAASNARAQAQAPARVPAQSGVGGNVPVNAGQLSTAALGGAAASNSQATGQMTFKRGTTRVPGRGDPRIDKIPAVLAPGEAVLNKPAADAIGRARIASANRRGVAAMGGVSGMEAAMNAHADQCHPVRRR